MVKTIASKAMDTGSIPVLRTFLKRALNMGSWCNGNTLVSKTKGHGSNPCRPVSRLGVAADLRPFQSSTGITGKTRDMPARPEHG